MYQFKSFKEYDFDGLCKAINLALNNNRSMEEKDLIALLEQLRTDRNEDAQSPEAYLEAAIVEEIVEEYSACGKAELTVITDDPFGDDISEWRIFDEPEFWYPMLLRENGVVRLIYYYRTVKQLEEGGEGTECICRRVAYYAENRKPCRRAGGCSSIAAFRVR